jgi:hypothetical protein
MVARFYRRFHFIQMSTNKSNSPSTAELKRQIAELKKQVASLQKRSVVKTAKTPGVRWKSILAWACVSIATALLVVGNVFFWAGNTVVNTDKYVATVGPLIEKPEIRSGIAQYTTDKLFEAVDVSQYVQTALPPRADFLAPQLTGQLKAQTQKSLESLLASPKVKQYWYDSLARRHEALIKFSKSYEGNGTVEVSDIYNQLSKKLADTKLSFLAGKKLPASVGSIQVTTVGWLPALHKVANNIGLYQLVASVLFAGLSMLAIVLSKNRRRKIVQISLIFGATMFVSLVAVRIGRGIVVSHAAQTYQPAIQVAYSTVMRPLVVQTVTVLLASFLLGLLAWISGPYKIATAIRGRAQTLLSGNLHQAVFGQENALTNWADRYKKQLQWGAVVVIGIIMLLVRLSPILILIYGLLILLIVLLIEFLAAPQ